MKLSSFRIKSYRSVVDTDWRPLAPDGITALIGQNESGKTSILEALESFYNSTITEDVMRSDDTSPQVACSFSDVSLVLAQLPQEKQWPDTLIETIKKTDRVNIVRSWPAQGNTSSTLDLEEEVILKIFRDHDALRASAAAQLDQHVTAVASEIEAAENAVGAQQERLKSLGNELAEATKLLKNAEATLKSAPENDQKQASSAHNAAKTTVDDVTTRQTSTAKAFETAQARLDSLRVKHAAVLEILEASEAYDDA